MKTGIVRRRWRGRRSPLAAGLLLGAGLGLMAAGEARAETFTLGDGWEGRVGLDVSVGAAMRARSADKNLIARGNGGVADGTTTDDGDRNYKRGDFYSALGKAVGEFELKKDGYGVFLRGKAWYDAAAERGSVATGHSANGYRRNSSLDDSDFYNLSKFKGVELLDAYAFANVNVTDSNAVSFKAGNHVVNWGEGLFVPGVSQYNIVDGAAARRPGAQVKEILLPIPQVSFNAGLAEGLSLEGFYQLAWKHSVFEGCGTFWGPSDVLNCSTGAVAQTPAPYGDEAGFNGIRQLGGLTAQLGNAGTIKPRNSGQFGLAARYFASDLGADFGLYYAQYHARMPIYSLKKTATPRSIYGLAGRHTQYFHDFSAEDIKVYGVSASTVIGGWSVGGEVSHSRDVPVQLNTSDMNAGLTGAGPLASRYRGLAAGAVARGYDLKNKTQFQISTIKSFPNVLGAESLSLVGEAAFQHWSGIGDSNTSVRYGRSPLYGRAATATSACATTATEYCDSKGYATSNSWGLRARVGLNYADVFAGVNLSPYMSVAWDVSGYSPDGTFIQDRVNVGLGVRADLLQKYYADLTFSTYNHNAKYDAQRDRDFIALVVGATF